MSFKHWFLILLLLPLLMACQEDLPQVQTEETGKSEAITHTRPNTPSADRKEDAPTPYWHNPPLPSHCQELRILAIGNSYTWDGTTYIEEILDAAGLENNRWGIYQLHYGGASLKFWCEQLRQTDTSHFLHQAGGSLPVAKRKAPVAELLRQPWDVIVMQQSSVYAIDYTTYNPYLREMIDSIRHLCPNPQVTLAWQLVHAYGRDYAYNNGIVSDERWQRISQATQQMVANEGIDIVIPTGTAIQRARNSALQTPYDLTRDQIHLCYGVARYIASCCWIETLFRPTFGIHVKGNPRTHAITEWEWNDADTHFVRESCSEVNESNRDLCQQIALDACAHPYQLEEDPTTGIKPVR